MGKRMRFFVGVGFVLGICVSAWGQGVYEAWVARYNGLESTAVSAPKLVVGDSGYVYVTAHSDINENEDCLILVKYNPRGDKSWVRYFTAQVQKGGQVPRAIALDKNGDIYIAAEVWSGNTDVLVIKYSSLGDTVWTRRLSFFVNANDYARALAVDDSGNVYVAGVGGGIGGGTDIFLAKYNSQGDTMWVRNYDSSPGVNDESQAMVLDGYGNIYVSGSSGTGSLVDFVTLKFASNGQTQWVRDYNGPGNTSDFAIAMAADKNGNVLVTGPSDGAGTGPDYATIKYSPYGDTLWVRRYVGAGDSGDIALAIAVDDSGYAYVTGASGYGPNGTSAHCTTIKYSQNGDMVWVTHHDRVNNSINWPRALVLDSLGNTYVTGVSEVSGANSDDYMTIKIASNGSVVWDRYYDGPGHATDQAFSLGLDALGNLYVTGEVFAFGDFFGGPRYDDVATIKYVPDGTQEWARVLGYGNGYDAATALCVDNLGNVYTTGYSWGGKTGYDYVTVKNSPYGNILWARRFNGPGNGDDIANDIQFDEGGGIYVAGGSEAGSSTDYLTIKYSTSGDTLWTRGYDGPGQGTDEATDLAIDSTGNVYVTGYSLGQGTAEDFATIKYSATGEPLWTKRYNSSTDSSDAASSIGVDETGNVYVTGSGIIPGNYYDYITIKYSTDGNVEWVKTYNGPGNYDDQASEVAIDDSGCVYVTGSSWSGYETFDDWATIKYSPLGETVWVRRFDGISHSTDIANAITVDKNRNVYVTGYSVGEIDPDFTTAKYSPDGETLWVRVYNGPANGYDEARKVMVDSSGSVYVTGYSEGLGTGFDYVTIKYSQDGSLLWLKRHNGAMNGNDFATDLSINREGNIYVTGESWGDWTDFDYSTIKYAPTSITSPGSDVLVHLTDSITITFDSVEVGGITIVTTSSQGPQPPNGFQVIPKDPPVYYEIQTTATYVDSFTICFVYDDGEVQNESLLDIFHYIEVSADSFDWQEVTASLDTISNIICGRVGSLSQFVIAEPVCVAKPGDANASGTLTLADIISTVNYIFNKPGCTPAPLCWLSGFLCRGDWNGSGTVTLSDVIRGVNYIFNKPGGPWAPLPSGACCLPLP